MYIPGSLFIMFCRAEAVRRICMAWMVFYSADFLGVDPYIIHHVCMYVRTHILHKTYRKNGRVEEVR